MILTERERLRERERARAHNMCGVVKRQRTNQLLESALYIRGAPVFTNNGPTTNNVPDHPISRIAKKQTRTVILGYRAHYL
jgi:hypothetical protein